APDVAAQLGQLRAQIPKAVAHLRGWAADVGWTAPLPEEIERPETLVTGTVTVGGLADVFSTLFGIFGNVLIALFVGIVIAARPSLYVAGLMHLVPHRRREDAAEILARLGCAMRQWLVGRFASMGVIAVLTSVGLLLL